LELRGGREARKGGTKEPPYVLGMKKSKGRGSHQRAFGLQMKKKPRLDWAGEGEVHRRLLLQRDDFSESRQGKKGNSMIFGPQGKATH